MTERVYAPSTCGFLPLHLYEGPDLDHASEIVAGINSLAFCAMGLGDAVVAKIAKLSLREMMDAVDVVERFNRKPTMLGETYSISMVPAERLVAAAYTLLNYASYGRDDDDDIVVRQDVTRWGEKKAHFVIVGARCASKINADEEDDQEQAA
jgi:hypothetical protein